MRELTQDVKEQIRDGWKVGVIQNDAMVVYDVISRDDDEIIGKERWIIYPKKTGKPIEEVRIPIPNLMDLSEEELKAWKKTQKAFALITLNEIVSCLSNADGNIYSAPGITEQYGIYE